MYRPNLAPPGRVSLVQANDTVRAVTASPAPSTTSTITNASGFAPPASMTKQPLRVLARPPPPARNAASGATSAHVPSHHDARQYATYAYPHQPMQHPHPPPGYGQGRSYSELLEMAELQKRQIEANAREEERRKQLQARGHAYLDRGELAHRVRSLRREVAEEELELKRLTELERETRMLRVRNTEAARTVEVMTKGVDEEQQKLRRAAAKVDSLRAQLEELHRRRRAALKAAQTEQKRMNMAQAHSAQMAQRSTASATPTLQSATASAEQSHASRPRASVEPFQIQQTKPSEEPLKGKESGEGSEGRVRHPPIPGDGMGAAPSAAAKIRVGEQTSLHATSIVTTSSASPSASSSASSQNREDISPSPPKDPHPSAPSSSESTVSSGGATVSTFSSSMDAVPLPSRTIHHHSVVTSIAAAGGDDEPDAAAPRLRGGRTDLVSLRSDSLKATKRRSWAASESTTFSEADAIRRVLLEEQRKGRTHFLPDIGASSPSSAAPIQYFESSSSSFSALASSSGVGEDRLDQIDEEQQLPARGLADSAAFSASSSSSLPPPQQHPAAETAASSPATPASSFASPALLASAATTTAAAAAAQKEKEKENDAALLDRPTSLVIVPVKQVEETSSVDESASLCSTRSSDDTLEMVIPPATKPPVKGILRSADTPKKGLRIEFDPLALLLDAALEGQIEQVKESAGKLADVSAPNDEGITALHNAICAGHYEIVRFLIDANADVNAQDSDGWTPLHCAASCNNLPMVRVLVEGGACVLASTLSDNETPVQKCEEEEDGYDGCLRYLVAAHNATGTANGGMVYAAYAYDAQHEDELSFAAGERLRVLEKDTPESGIDKGWWRCERAASSEAGEGEKGLAPRAYLALYPSLKFRPGLGFVPFDLSLEANNNEKEK